MRVMKFGGGCLRDTKSLLKIEEILRTTEGPTVIVVSAVYGVTNQIIEGMNEALKSETSISSTIEGIRKRYDDLVQECILSDSIRSEVTTALESKIKKLERLLYGIAYTEEIVDTVRALILSHGERLSAILLAGVLVGREREAKALDADEIGIVTEPVCDNATAILPVVKKNLKHHLLPLLERGCIPVVTGYFGCTELGKISTFGRNGSDYSAAVIAHALDAEGLDIWKDVDGFMTADPKMIENARRIEYLSYYEAAELSYFGAQVLHPRTVEPLIDTGITISIRNINAPRSEVTLIHPEGYEEKDVIKSVTYNDGVSVLKVHGAGVGYKPGIIGDIGQRLSQNNVNIYSVITSQTCINLLLDREDSQESLQVLQPLIGGVIERINVNDDIALIAVVGEGLLKTEGLAARVFSAVAERSINVEMISSGASDVAYYFTVKENDMESAIRAVHDRFFCKQERT
ncbi:MAG: aspartate kinase [Candidatus Thorarchaeota archaeon]